MSATIIPGSAFWSWRKGWRSLDVNLRRVVFGITEHHIKNGIAWHCEQCPGALAVLDRVVPDVSVSLDDFSVCFSHRSGCETSASRSPESCRQEVPEELSDFTYRFDRRQRGAPVEFVLDVPEWAYNAEKANSFRLSKTLVRVAAANRNQGWIDVVVPSWHSMEKIRLKKDRIPEDVFLAAAPEKRFHVWVNVDNNIKAALHFADWEET